MDGPFGSYSYHPSFFGRPVYPVEPIRQTRRSAYADRKPPVVSKPGRKVVQIPVQFVGPDSDRRPESAMKIQKVFRGFLVRKSVRKIREIKSQVDEVEAKLLRNEVVEVIRRNESERLRMSEGLMNLLLKLDGIRGVDLGIRLCRKGVTRKAIGLQDKIDAICAAESEGNIDEEMETGNQGLEVGAPAAEFVGTAEIGEADDMNELGFGNSEDSDDFGEDSTEESKGLDHVPQELEKMDAVMESDALVSSKVNSSEETCVETGITENNDLDEHIMEEMLVQSIGKDEIKGEGEEKDDTGKFKFSVNSDDLGEISADQREELEGGNDVGVEEETKEVEKNHLDAGIIDVPVTSMVEVSQGTCPVKEAPNNLDSDQDNSEPETLKEILVEDKGKQRIIDPFEDEDMVSTMSEMPVERNGGDTTVENKRKCEMLEQMMEDNKRAMHMITQLYDQNEMQLQMLDALANRVEFLEKAYVCDKLRNKRKKMKKNKYAQTCMDY